MSLNDYYKKRDFQQTPEPKGGNAKPTDQFRFVVQRHQASRLHFDLRLEIDGVLKSWAIPKGPSMNPKDKRLAVHTEDHPLDYLFFEGEIPKGNYGAGKMEIWDAGSFEPLGKSSDPLSQYQKGDIKLTFYGTKLKGSFALVHTKNGEKNNHWLLIKKKDRFSSDLAYDANNFRSEISSKEDEVIAVSPSKALQPMLATTASAPFSQVGWIYEIKWDGYRMLSVVEKGKVQLLSRNGISFNLKFPLIRESLSGIPYDVILDGEVVIVDDQGLPHFQDLQNYTLDSPGELRYYVFDILFLNDHDTTTLPLTARKSLIKDIINGLPHVWYCEHVSDMGHAFFQKAVDAGLEGVIAKKADSKYFPGIRTDYWLKIKAEERQEAIICGYTSGENSAFGSLILGVYKNDTLTYIGNCGSGFNDELQKDLLKKFKPLIQEESPFLKKINLKGRKATWLNPVLVCEVKFSNWTKAGSMRHPVFKGLRNDKTAEDIGVEKTVKAPSQAHTQKKAEDILEVNGIPVPISNLEKIYWPDEGITKFQLIDYYIHIADYILPYLINRPQNLHRHPNGIYGESFYQKDTSGIFPHWIATSSIYSTSAAKEIQYLLCQNEATLLYMANLGCIEINPWNSPIDHLDFPDYTVIDLDPSEKNTFEEVIEVAQCTYEILNRLKIKGYCKTSGSRGLHIYLPMAGQYTYEESRDFTKLICYLILEELPELTTMERAIKNRNDKIYLDYLQNRRGQTLAAPYCARPKPHAKVSTPLSWEEVKTGLFLEDYTIFTVPKRLDTIKDIFWPVISEGIDIEKVLERMKDF
jgi:bifunctional non-homologous end joining protein LigD